MPSADEVAQKLVEVVRAQLPAGLAPDEQFAQGKASAADILSKTRERFDQLWHPAVLEIGDLRAGKRFPEGLTGAEAGRQLALEWREYGGTAELSGVPPEIPKATANLQREEFRVAAARLPFAPEPVSLWHVWFAKSSSRPFESDAFLVTGIDPAGGSKSYVLDWTSDPIYRLFREQRVRSSAAPQMYLRFFLRMVRGKDGRNVFTLIERKDDFARRIPWRDAAADYSAAEASALPHLRKIDRRQVVADGGLRFITHVVYSDGLFLCEFSINRDGLVTMLQNQPAAENLPLRTDW